MSDSPAAEAIIQPDTAELGADQHGPESAQRLSIRLLLSAWIPVLFCIMVIAAESTPYFGADHTSNPLRQFFEFFHGPFTGPEWWRFHHYVRKCGHFLGYGILSIAWFRAFWLTWRPHIEMSSRLWAAHLLAMLGTFAVASCDEIHQTFLPNRTGTPWDVLLDCCGGALMQVLVLCWMRSRAIR